jgi:N-acetylneuraminic acid mutarotase
MKSTLTGIVILTVVVISLSFFGTTHAYFNSQQITGPHLISTWQSYLWTQTTQADFLAGVSGYVNTSASPGSIILDNQTVGPSIFATRGSSTIFLQYYISNDTWVTQANTLASVGLGGGARHIGLGNISAVRGSNSNNFWIYNLSSNTWSAKAVIPVNVNTGGTLSDYIGSGNISTLRGSGTNTFWTYNISKNNWSRMSNAPGNVGAGGALAFIGSGNITALRGAASREFWIYNISRNNWSRLADTPGNVGSGGALAFDNRNYVYAFNGTNTRNFWRYNISANTWSSLATIPGNVGSGGSLVSDTGNYIYAFNGSSKPSFWRYNIATNSWSDAAVANPTQNVGSGGSLTYVDGSSGYFPSGSLASAVYDTGIAGGRWESLLWDNSPIPETNITFEVRASDSVFTKNDAIHAWQQSGWPSPVNSGLPSGRYLQWRATLSTGNSSRTPILNEVRISYS